MPIYINDSFRLTEIELPIILSVFDDDIFLSWVNELWYLIKLFAIS